MFQNDSHFAREWLGEWTADSYNKRKKEAGEKI